MKNKLILLAVLVVVLLAIIVVQKGLNANQPTHQSGTTNAVIKAK